MEITVKGKKQALHFGVRFVNELDKVAPMENNGVTFGMGLQRSLPALKTCDTAVLANVLYCATITNTPRPSLNDIYDFVDGCTDLETIFDDAVKAIKESNATKLAAKKMQA